MGGVRLCPYELAYRYACLQNEATKVNYLMGGLCPRLTKRLYRLEIDSTAKFLKAVKLDDEANTLAKAKEGGEGVSVAAFTSKSFSRRDAKFATGVAGNDAAGRNTEPTADETRRQLQSQLAELQKKLKALDGGSGTYDSKDSSSSRRGARRGRDAEGKIVCYGCNASGHIRPNRPKSESQPAIDDSTFLRLQKSIWVEKPNTTRKG